MAPRMKQCIKCGEHKPLAAFPKRKSSSDGVRSSCKTCTAEAKRAWYSDNASKVIAKDMATLRANPERLQAAMSYKRTYAAARRAADPQGARARCTEWRRNNADRARAYNREWHSRNKERHLETSRAWKRAHPELVRVNWHNRRALEKSNGGKLSVGLAQKLIRLQKGKCACCGLDLGKNYHLDHIVPIARGGTNTDDNIQLLRAECNFSKGAKHPIEYMRQKGFLL